MVGIAPAKSMKTLLVIRFSAVPASDRLPLPRLAISRRVAKLYRRSTRPDCSISIQLYLFATFILLQSKSTAAEVCLAQTSANPTDPRSVHLCDPCSAGRSDVGKRRESGSFSGVRQDQLSVPALSSPTNHATFSDAPTRRSECRPLCSLKGGVGPITQDTCRRPTTAQNSINARLGPTKVPSAFCAEKCG